MSGETHVSGVGATPLSGVGPAWRYDESIELPPEPPVDEVSTTAERERFKDARERVHEALLAEQERSRERVGNAEAEIFEAHQQFLEDPTIIDATEEAIDNGLLAEHAVERAFADAIEQLEEAGGRMAERADDLRDVRDRVLRELTGERGGSIEDVPEGAIVVAERLTPSETVSLDPDDVAGFVTAEGGRTSHAAIVARSLGIPAVVGIGDAVESIDDEETLLVGGANGDVVLDPSSEAVEAATRTDETAVRHEHVATSNGRTIEVAANVGSRAAVDAAVERGSDGIGLFRTEFFFLEQNEPPTEEEQFEVFEHALAAFEGDPVVVRTLDVGGDKPVPYLDVEAGTNPFLGLRGVRLAPGACPDMFETQMRALLRAAATDHGDALSVMFPLISSVSEFDEVLSFVESVAEDLDEEGVEYVMPDIGVMIETPAAVFLAPELADRVDFFSIGTNDLTQYVTAASREDERVEDLHDPLSPAVLRAITRVVEAAHETDCWVGMCGEMAGNPSVTRLLVGLGLDELSMSAVTVPEVKASIEDIDDESAASLAERALAAETRDEVAALLDGE